MNDHTKIMLLGSHDGDADPLPERLSDLLESQFNVISRKQAVRYGITESAIRHRLRPGGAWQKILPGVYSVETGTVTSAQRHMAALLHAGKNAVITGPVAVRYHHRNCAGGNDVEVLVPAECRVKGLGYVRIRRTERMPDDVRAIRSIRYAPLVRAAADATRAMLKPEDARTLLSEVLHKGGGCTVAELTAELDAGPSAGSGLLRAALVEVSSGVRSEGEHDLKTCITRSVLPEPMYNPRLFLPDGTFLAIPDAWWPGAGVAAEVDSLEHHILVRDHEATVARRNRMEAAGIRVLQFLPKDIKPGWPVHLQDLKAAIEHGMERAPLPVIAVPASVTDVQTFLRTKLSDRNSALAKAS